MNFNTDEDKFVYIVEDSDGNRCSNWGTGTKVYTKKHNAEKLCKQGRGRYKVVTYKLVKVGEEDE